MTFARAAAVQGRWMLPGALDKPPLSISLSALSMVAIGIVADADGVLHLDPVLGEFAGRAPNALLTILLTALLMRLARQHWRDERAAWLAGLLASASPFLLSYGASAFTDLSMLFFLTASLVLCGARKAGGAGLALGLAFWCKQQALLYLPLIALLSLRHGRGQRAGLQFALGLLAAGLPLLVWDGLRPGVSIFSLGAANNLPADLLAAPQDLLPRLLEWLRLSSWLIAPPLVSLPLIGLALIGLCMSRSGPGAQPKSRMAAILLFYILAYLVFHVLIAFPQYDRYLLPILPLAILLAAAGLAELCRRVTYGDRLLMTLALVLIISSLLMAGLGAPLTPGPEPVPGILELARHLNDKPVATVLYDPFLGWELGYYLGPWHDKRRVHYPDPGALAQGALALPETGDRYLVTPADRPHQAWLQALTAAGFAIDIDYQRPGYIVYRLTPQ